MVTVVLGAVVSLGIALFALAVIAREFQGRWSQVAAALAFDERAFVGEFAEFRAAASPRRLQPVPARIRRQPSWRAAA